MTLGYCLAGSKFWGPIPTTRCLYPGTDISPPILSSDNDNDSPIHLSISFSTFKMAGSIIPARAVIPFLVGMMLLTGVCNTLLTKYQVCLLSLASLHHAPQANPSHPGQPMCARL